MDRVQVGALGWSVALLCLVALLALLDGALARHRVALGPAGRITVTRAVLACAVAGLTAQSFVGPDHTAIVVTLAGVGLALDAVDGRVARRTDTVTPFGARFDMEVDAFLIAVLSLYVAPDRGLVGARDRCHPLRVRRGRVGYCGGSGAHFRRVTPRRWWRRSRASSSPLRRPG